MSNIFEARDLLVKRIEALGTIDELELAQIRAIVTEQLSSDSDAAFAGDASQLSALGKSGAVFERFEYFDAPAHLEMITLSSDDMTARCPITNQPDFYSVDIMYTPRKRILETKTLKLYLETFRETGIFAEHLASKIAEDVQAALLCEHVTVTLKQKIRGGIETLVYATLDGSDESEQLIPDEHIQAAVKKSSYGLGDMHFEEEYN